MTIPQKTPTAGDIMESVIIKGDLAKLTADERVIYYREVCKSIGLNPLTRPLEYITLSGKLTLYARRDAADQLRKLNGISLEIISEQISDGLMTVHVRAFDRDGRKDEDLGIVPLPDTMRGEVRSNQMLKAVTKAKRRVTLSISGLGFLDETEVEDVPTARRPRPPAKNVMQELPHDAATGEIAETAGNDTEGEATAPAVEAAPSATAPGGAVLSLEDLAREAARHGDEAFRVFYRNRSAQERKLVNAIGDELRGLIDAAESENAENPDE